MRGIEATLLQGTQESSGIPIRVERALAHDDANEVFVVNGDDGVSFFVG